MIIRITDEQIDKIGVVEAGVLDGYWESEARKEIRDVYIQGMIDALISIRGSYGTVGSGLSNSIRNRLAQLHRELQKPPTNSNKQS